MSNILAILFIYSSIFPFIGFPGLLLPADIQPIFLILLFCVILSLRKIRLNSYALPLILISAVPVFLFPLVILADGVHSSTVRAFATILFPSLILPCFASLKPKTIFFVLNQSSILILTTTLFQSLFGRNVVDLILFRPISESASGRGLTSLFPEPSFLVTQCTFMLCILTLFILSNPLLLRFNRSRRQFIASVVGLSVSAGLSLSVTAIYYFVTLLLSLTCLLFAPSSPIPFRWPSRLNPAIFVSSLLILSITIFIFPRLSSQIDSSEGIRLLQILPNLFDPKILLSVDVSTFTRAVSFCSSTIYLFHNPFFLSSSSLLSLSQLSFCEEILSSNAYLYSLTDSPYNPLLFYSSMYGVFGLFLIFLMLSYFLYCTRQLLSFRRSIYVLLAMILSLLPFLLQTSPFNPAFWLYLSTPMLLLSKRRSASLSLSADLDCSKDINHLLS